MPNYTEVTTVRSDNKKYIAEIDWEDETIDLSVYDKDGTLHSVIDLSFDLFIGLGNFIDKVSIDKLEKPY